MNPTRIVVLLVVLAALAAGGIEAARAPQEPAEKVVILPPWQRPHWDSRMLESDHPVKLLEVPKGERFVLTDLWTMRPEEYQDQAPDPADRLWIEVSAGSARRVVLDARLYELPAQEIGGRFAPLPLRFETGVVLRASEQLWINYRFAGRDKQDFQRRATFSGYFEEEN